MRVEEIKYNNKNATITVDGEKLILSLDIVMKYNLYEDKFLDCEELKRIVDDSNKDFAKTTLFNLLSRYHKSEHQARNKLKEKGFTHTAIDYAISVAKEYNYINDEKYVSLYVLDNKLKKGRLKIKNELYQKGISREVIENALDKVSDKEEKALAEKISRKYMQKLDKTLKSKQKLFLHLQQKGFSYDIITDIINKYDYENN